MARVNEESNSFTCHPHVYPQVEWTIPAFTLQPQSVTALWLVFISRPAGGRKLSCLRRGLDEESGCGERVTLSDCRPVRSHISTRRPASADRTARRHVLPMGSVLWRLDIKGRELPPANILIPFERQLIALQLCRWQLLYNEILHQTSRPLLWKLSERRQFRYLIPILRKLGRRRALVDGSLESPCRLLMNCNWTSFLFLTIDALQGRLVKTHCFLEGVNLS